VQVYSAFQKYCDVTQSDAHNYAEYSALVMTSQFFARMTTVARWGFIALWLLTIAWAVAVWAASWGAFGHHYTLHGLSAWEKPAFKVTCFYLPFLFVWVFFYILIPIVGYIVSRNQAPKGYQKVGQAIGEDVVDMPKPSSDALYWAFNLTGLWTVVGGLLVTTFVVLYSVYGLYPGLDLANPHHYWWGLGLMLGSLIYYVFVGLKMVLLAVVAFRTL